MKLSVRDMTLVALFAALMVVGAFIRITNPLIPVSVTFQPFFCALAGVLLGSRLAALSMSVYVAMGLIGIPVFTQGGGLIYVFKPSFGYLLGFIAGAYVIGKVLEAMKSVNFGSLIVSLIAGLVVIYAVGIPYSYAILRFYKNDLNAVLVSTAMIPVIIKDLVLYIVIASVATGVLPALKKAGLVPA